MPDKYTTDLAVTHVALDTVTMPLTPSRLSKSRTLAVSRAQWLERRRSGSYWASAPVRGSVWYRRGTPTLDLTAIRFDLRSSLARHLRPRESFILFASVAALACR